MDYTEKLKLTRIPRRFWGVSLEDYEVTGDGTKRVKDAVEQYLDTIHDKKEWGTGLTLLGPPGTGKTMLLSVIGRYALEQGYSVLYVPLALYIRWMLNMISWQDWATAEQDWEKLRQVTLRIRNKVDFLLLDDVGKEHKTNSRYAEDEFDFLIRHRYDCARPTLMTSNTPLADWVTAYSEAMESFIHEAAPVIEFDVKDRRKRP